MAFNLNFYKGATITQIRDSVDYKKHLLTAEEVEQLKKDKAIPVDEVPKLCNEIITPAAPAGGLAPGHCPDN
jgi:hypothetical protein